MHRDPILEYCSEHDGYYEIVDGKWTEATCDDPDCHFCPSRPKVHDAFCYCIRRMHDKEPIEIEE